VESPAPSEVPPPGPLLGRQTPQGACVSEDGLALRRDEEHTSTVEVHVMSPASSCRSTPTFSGEAQWGFRGASPAKPSTPNLASTMKDEESQEVCVSWNRANVLGRVDDVRHHGPAVEATLPPARWPHQQRHRQQQPRQLQEEFLASRRPVRQQQPMLLPGALPRSPASCLEPGRLCEARGLVAEMLDSGGNFRSQGQLGRHGTFPGATAARGRRRGVWGASGGDASGSRSVAVPSRPSSAPHGLVLGAPPSQADDVDTAFVSMEAQEAMAMLSHGFHEVPELTITGWLSPDEFDSSVAAKVADAVMAATSEAPTQEAAVKAVLELTAEMEMEERAAKPLATRMEHHARHRDPRPALQPLNGRMPSFPPAELSPGGGGERRFARAPRCKSSPAAKVSSADASMSSSSLALSPIAVEHFAIKQQRSTAPTCLAEAIPGRDDCSSIGGVAGGESADSSAIDDHAFWAHEGSAGISGDSSYAESGGGPLFFFIGDESGPEGSDGGVGAAGTFASRTLPGAADNSPPASSPATSGEASPLAMLRRLRRLNEESVGRGACGVAGANSEAKCTAVGRA